LRPQTHVTYELDIITMDGEEMCVVFSHEFDSEIYDGDEEATDLMMVNFKMQELKEKHGDGVFLLGWSIARGGVCH
jgi:hypothetical protein